MTLLPLGIRGSVGADTLVSADEAARLSGWPLDPLRARLAHLPAVRPPRRVPLYRWGDVLAELLHRTPAPLTAVPDLPPDDRPLTAPKPRRSPHVR